MRDPYYNPEDYGLTIIGSLDDPQASYSFDMFVAWKDSNNRVYVDTDAGCSCPSPFEDVRSVDELTHCIDLDDFCIELDAYTAEMTRPDWYTSDMQDRFTASAREEFLADAAVLRSKVIRVFQEAK